MLWGPRSKPRGILGGLLNIHRIIYKSEQVKHLLNDSNLDLFLFSETWLKKYSPISACINVPGHFIFRRDRERADRVDCLCTVYERSL
jgi:hypothetical protein